MSTRPSAADIACSDRLGLRGNCSHQRDVAGGVSDSTRVPVRTATAAVRQSPRPGAARTFGSSRLRHSMTAVLQSAAVNGTTVRCELVRQAMTPGHARVPATALAEAVRNSRCVGPPHHSSAQGRAQRTLDRIDFGLSGECRQLLSEGPQARPNADLLHHVLHRRRRYHRRRRRRLTED